MTQPVEKTVRYYAFPVCEYGDFVIGLEKIQNIGLEAMQLWLTHWEETERQYVGTSLKPDVPLAMHAEMQGKLVMFTVRKTGLLVGNLMFILSSSMHVKGTTNARENGFFLLPAYRNGRIALKLLQYGEQCLKQLNINAIVMDDKSPVGGKPLDKFFDHLGFTKIAITYRKTIGNFNEDQD